ncbi:hypothetical protein F2P56_018186 [Juglans regia]|uniref:HTH La-type RNA-binding domain-containing protein n=2 Tax=Juglans regia TaxID=51240 RepID=A0A833U8U8_JUGRE|nr:la-related protein 1C-like [Juglans regia]KAF5462156.1 hypothetical protein F2P56_018186 [Juglans regia]
MATTADSPSTTTVPSGRAGENINSPQFRRKNLQSPWTQVVRGEVMESLSAVHSSPSSSSLSTASQPEQTLFSDCSPPKTDSPSPPPLDICSAVEGSDVNNGNVARQTKLAWNKLSNGVLEVGSVMDAAFWPALSESTKALPKSSVDSSSNIVTDASFSTSQGPVIPESPQKQATNNANPNSTTNHIFPVRQRSMKRGGGGNNRGGSTHSGFTHPPPSPPPFPVFRIAPNGYPNMVPGVPDPSHREFPYRSSHWETRPAGGFVSPSHSANDHRNTFRRGNFGPHQRGDGTYHNNPGGRRDHDRGNYGNARDVHLQPHRAPPRGFGRHPQPNAAAFVNPPMVRPFVNPMGFPEFYYIPPVSMEPYRPFIPHPLPLLMPEPPPLPALLVHQINYYFGDNNLVTDDFLRSHMDDQGWVPITLIASFPRVKKLSTNIKYILDSLKASTIVEVQDDKVRKRNDWKKWIPASALLPSDSGSVSPNNSSHDRLVTSFQKITVEEVDTNQSGVIVKADPISEPVTGRCLTESTGESQIPNGEVTQNTYRERN